MRTEIVKQLAALDKMTAGELKNKYQAVFGEPARSNHKDYLRKKIAWRIQANAKGGLSKRARRLALEIANDADLRIRAPRLRTGSGAGEQEARARPLHLKTSACPCLGPCSSESSGASPTW